MNFRDILIVFMLVISSSIYSQSILISGIVVDEGGNPLPGVTVLIEGTDRGTSTTFEGTYAIKADNENQSIQFSYISFETQSILIGSQSKIDVIMVESLESLEEVQVVAFQKHDSVFSFEIFWTKGTVHVHIYIQTYLPRGIFLNL